MAETEYVQWDSIPKNDSGNENSGYLKLESGNIYKIRPLFKPVKFYKYFHKKDGKARTAICGNPANCPVRDKHPELKKPSLRFAMYLIDRADGRVKILEGPQSVFRPIGSSLTATGNNPGGTKDGSDWSITVSGKGLNTTYDVVFISSTPLTEEEMGTIKETLEGDKKKLQKLYKIDTPEEIEKKLFGDLESTGENKETKSSAKQSSQDSDDSDFDANW